MTREASITAEQVAAAAAELKANGQKATLRAVRDVLGGGSMTTIQRHLARWNDGQPMSAAPAVEVPAAVLRGIQSAIDQATAEASALLRAELAEMRAALDAITAEAERTADALEAEHEHVQSQIEIIHNQSEELAAVRAELATTREQARHEADTLRAELARERAAAERARTELAKAEMQLATLPRLTADLDAYRQHNDEMRDRLTAAELAASTAHTQATALRDALELDRARLAKAEAERDSERKRGDAAQAELATARVQVTSQQTALDAAARELATCETRIKELKTTKAANAAPKVKTEKA